MLHHKCLKSASRAHQECIQNAPRVHQECAPSKSASRVHQGKTMMGCLHSPLNLKSCMMGKCNAVCQIKPPSLQSRRLSTTTACLSNALSLPLIGRDKFQGDQMQGEQIQRSRRLQHASPHFFALFFRVGQNRVHTPYLTVCMEIPLLNYSTNTIITHIRTCACFGQPYSFKLHILQLTSGPASITRPPLYLAKTTVKIIPTFYTPLQST